MAIRVGIDGFGSIGRLVPKLSHLLGLLRYCEFLSRIDPALAEGLRREVLKALREYYPGHNLNRPD